jgi:EAL domain-containing protein (putative c-di-GMP-specific phosphodiesterase class I)
MRRGKHSINILHELKEKGINLSIDDFGTGYSSLSNLKRISIDKLKIDRSFINDISDNPDATTIIEAIIAMARSMNLQVIAEGVETLIQFDFLSKKGCDQIQGYLAGKPVPAVEMEQLLREDQDFLCSHFLQS